MTKRLILFSTLFGALLAPAGCGHVERTMTRLSPGYEAGLQPPYPIASVPRKLAFSRGQFVDKRTESYLGVYRRELLTTYIETRDDLAGTLFRGLELLVTGAGHSWTQPATADLRLDVRLLTTMAEVAATVGSPHSTAVQIQLDVVDSRKGTLVYSGTYKGSESEATTFDASFDASFVRCIAAVGKDPYLVRALGKALE